MLAPKCPNKSNREGLHTNGFDNGLRLRLPLPENHYEPASAAPVPTRASSLLTSSAKTVSSDADCTEIPSLFGQVPARRIPDKLCSCLPVTWQKRMLMATATKCLESCMAWAHDKCIEEAKFRHSLGFCDAPLLRISCLQALGLTSAQLQMLRSWASENSATRPFVLLSKNAGACSLGRDLIFQTCYTHSERSRTECLPSHVCGV